MIASDLQDRLLERLGDKAEMPDVAAWLQKITGTMEQAMTEYWGEAQ